MSEPQIMKATAAERRLIERLTARPAIERLDAGELEIVDADDWTDVPDVEATRAVRVPANLYRRLQAASRKKRTTPDRLAAQWLDERLHSS